MKENHSEVNLYTEKLQTLSNSIQPNSNNRTSFLLKKKINNNSNSLCKNLVLYWQNKTKKKELKKALIFKGKKNYFKLQFY